MKWKAFWLVLLLIWAAHPGAGSAEGDAHFYDAAGRPLPQYEWIAERLKEYFPESVPPRITVQFQNQWRSSRFHPTDAAVLIHESVKNAPEPVIAHESCHLCLANLTKGASTREKFRFFDEGFAEVFENLTMKRFEAYKEEALTVAAAQHRRRNVSFARVQKWSEYYGDPETKTNFYAYPVGASFDLFIMDHFGKDRLLAFFKDIGETGDLARTVRNVLGSDLPELEAKWLRYLEEVDVSTAEPRIVKLFPENGATGVSIKTEEIAVQFDLPMARKIVFISDCRQGVCYKNAYWKSDRILAVKVKLLPNHRYRIALGDMAHGRFMSRAGSELPVTEWSFATGSE